MIDDRVPFTDRGSGDPRMARLLGELAALWPSARITLLAESGRDAERYAEPLLRQGIEVACPPVDWPALVRAAPLPLRPVIVSRQQNVFRFGGYLNATQPQALRVFDTEAFSFQRLERLGEILPPGKQRNDVRAEAAKTTRRPSSAPSQEADVVFCVSDDEARLVAEVAPGTPAFVLPGIVEALADPPGFDERKRPALLRRLPRGTRLSPNEDSLAYLAERRPAALLGRASRCLLERRRGRHERRRPRARGPARADRRLPSRTR